MLAKQEHIFRPAWVLYVGPGWVAATGLLVLTIKAQQSDILPLNVLKWFYLLPIAILGYAYLRWLLKGRIKVTPNEVVFRGWIKKIDQSGNTRATYLRRIIPRSQWSSIDIEGLLFPRVVWQCFGQKIVFEQVSHPRRLRRLLNQPADDFQEKQPIDLLPVLGLVVKLIGWLGCGLWNGSKWLAQQIAPHLKRARQWVLDKVRPAPLQDPEYARFLAFCQHTLLDNGSISVLDEHAKFYLYVLNRCHIASSIVNGHLEVVRRAHIQTIDDVKLRVTPAALSALWFDHLLAEANYGVTKDREQQPTLSATN